MVLRTCKSTITGMRTALLFVEKLTRIHEVKHVGVVLDGKVTWREHLQQKYNKAVALLWQCRRIVGKTWKIIPRIAHWIYSTIIVTL